MVLEKECRQKMEERYYPIEEKKEDGSLPYPTKSSESKKRFILKNKKEISELFEENNVFYTPDLKIIYKKNLLKQIRFIPCVSKKWGRGHERNRFKRLVREAMWKTIEELEKKDQLKFFTYNIAILPRTQRIKNKDYKMDNILSQIKIFLKKINKNNS